MKDESCADHQPGEIVATKYQLEHRLGRGGFGEVWRAERLADGAPVALKLLPSELTSDDSVIQRFEREARLAQRLKHPNTVRILDFGKTERQLPYIAWELLEGRSLDSVLDEGGPFSLSRAVRVTCQIARSLSEAHRVGIIHLDIKPNNIFLLDDRDETDVVKVLDFGHAKPITPLGLALEKVTDQFAIIGTPAYMAPEQVLQNEVAPATDLYALGLLLCEMLTGEVVVKGASPVRVLLIQASTEPVPLPEEVLSSPFGPIVEGAMHKELAARYQSADDLADDLETALARIDRTWHDLLLPGGNLSHQTGSFSTNAIHLLSSEEEEEALLDTGRATIPVPDPSWSDEFK